MGETGNDGGKNWLESLIGGGLPQLLAGPAGKAISRLVGAGIEIPAAYLDKFAQGIRDNTEARSEISRAIARQAAALAVNDPDLMDRALNSMLNRSYRTQVNKDAIAANAMRELVDNPPAPESAGPSESWLSRFERYAEDASSDDLRLMFGKLLAGEIRQPGAISPTTLHFASMLDENTAKIIEKVLPVCIIGGAALIEALDPKISIPQVAYIEQAGFCSAGKTVKFVIGADGLLISPVTQTEYGFAIQGEPNTEIRVQAAILSHAGADLFKIVGRDFDFQALANFMLTRSGVKRFHYGKMVRSGTTTTMPEPTELFRR